MKKQWVTVKLGDVSRIQSGVGFPKKFQGKTEGDLPFFKVSDMNIAGNEQAMINSNNYITFEVQKELSAKVFPAGSIIFPKVGGAILTNKKRVTSSDCCVDNNIMGLIPSFESIDERFLRYFMGTLHLYEWSNKSNPPSIRQTTVASWPICLPELSEQKRIVAILDEAFTGIDAAIANTEKNLANTRELFESYLKTLFDRCLDQYLGKRLSEICTFSSGGTPSKKNEHFWDGDTPWISGRDMKSTRLFDSHLHISQVAIEQSATRIAPVGSLLMLVRGMGLAHGAQVAEVRVPCAFNQDIKAILPDNALVSRYLVFALKHQINSNENVMSSAAHGTLKINFERLKNVVVPIPPISEQEEIVSSIDAIGCNADQLETTYQAKLEALSELKQSILKKALSGELTDELVEKETEEAVA